MAVFKRQTNFNNVEKLALIDLVDKYASIVENKKTDEVKPIEKAETWKKIAAEYNSISNLENRDERAIKNLWTNLKANTKKHFAELKRQTNLTGGGRSNVKPNIIFEKVLNIIGHSSVFGLNNSFDSDAIEGTGTVWNIMNVHKDENDDPDDPKEIYQDNEINEWKDWNPRKLSQPISNPLKMIVKGDSITGVKKKNNHKMLTETQNILLNSKIELTNLMKENLIHKQAIEKNVIKEQLRNEKLKGRLLKAELKKLNQQEEDFASSDLSN
ncbi:uncharacterized protein [Prorops nasuta]|uniref:uncharacterized protein isoform X2 n=1 Tax=Prorops nasuta TaxID=863751 RepID=UPI0034CF9979